MHEEIRHNEKLEWVDFFFLTVFISVHPGPGVLMLFCNIILLRRLREHFSTGLKIIHFHL